jgi:hypothetical protein
VTAFDAAGAALAPGDAMGRATAVGLTLRVEVGATWVPGPSRAPTESTTLYLAPRGDRRSAP